MLLPVLVRAARKDVNAVCKCRSGVSKNKLLRRYDKTLSCRSHTRVGHGLKQLDVGRDLLCGLAGRFFRIGNNDRDRLALKMHFALG
jgi:hypothetical protein